VSAANLRAAVLLPLALVGCSQTDDAGARSTKAPGANADGDCLTDAEELARGTDPTRNDSDGDGVSDCDELACVSDPLDTGERCYAGA